MESAVKRIMDSCKGESKELKKSCCSFTGIGYRRLLRLYNGEIKDMKLSEAKLFIAWANQNKPAGMPDFTAQDMITEAVVQS